MTGVESRRLRRRLVALGGYSASVFRYPTVSEPLDAIVAKLAVHLRTLDASRLHIVAHSLGGLVVLRLFERVHDLPPGRVVFLGSPMQGSRAALGVDRFAFAQRLLGSIVTTELLRERRENRWTSARELGVIAGRRAVGLGRLFAGFREPNDGTIAVRETEIAGATDRIVLPVSHLGMMLSEEVAAQSHQFLAQGRFRLAS